ncbi:glycosyltransferase family 2 protein [Paenibacillus koleovorans]|uniref:glycosyltransferase family 2 protein n=1 Tax=Paenibacillus koleovorans TaxID=121608 RepID=UPI000FDBC5A5|nr:glycosyltransferase family 2 protein [Paenibacillus koleovorans]
MTLTSIIIPTYNGLHLLAECIEAIRTYTTDTPYELIVVDNGSTDGTAAYCKANRIPFVSLPHNRGFPEACNYGMRMASGDALLLHNNDVVVSRGWLTNMLAALESSPEIGIVGPVTNYVSGRQKIDIHYGSISEFQSLAAAMNRSDRGKWQDVTRLVGLCFLFKRELMDRIGELDERFSPGHYEDDDYCYRARQAGYRLLIAGDTVVHHHGSASFRKQGQEKLDRLVETNYRKFMDKWGVDPRAFI